MEEKIIDTNTGIRKGLYYFCIDVESVGLYGNPFAVAYVIYNNDGFIMDKHLEYCPIDTNNCLESDLKWIKENVLPHFKDVNYTCDNVSELCNNFWNRWIDANKRYEIVVMIGDVIYPVETNFISRCIQFDLKNRQFSGPYPFCDISSVENCISPQRFKELKEYESNLLKHYPEHNPMNDAERCGLKWLFIKNDLENPYNKTY